MDERGKKDRFLPLEYARIVDDCADLVDMWVDYPHKLTEKQKAIFDAENPYWMEWLGKRDGI